MADIKPLSYFKGRVYSDREGSKVKIIDVDTGDTKWPYVGEHIVSGKKETYTANGTIFLTGLDNKGDLKDFP